MVVYCTAVALHALAGGRQWSTRGNRRGCSGTSGTLRRTCGCECTLRGTRFSTSWGRYRWLKHESEEAERAQFVQYAHRWRTAGAQIIGGSATSCRRWPHARAGLHACMHVCA